MSSRRSGHDSIDGVVAAMQDRLAGLPADKEHRREFLSTYQRTTVAVGKAVADHVFDDGEWVEDWDIAFANLYLAALDADLSGGRPPRPWPLPVPSPAGPQPPRHPRRGLHAPLHYDPPPAPLRG